MANPRTISFILVVSCFLFACREVDVVTDDGSSSDTGTADATADASSSVSTTTASSSSASTGSGGAPAVDLTVTLSGNTPQGKTVIYDAEQLHVLTVNLTASPTKDAPIDRICFTDAGTGLFSDIAAARFYNASTGYVEADVDHALQTICVEELVLTVSAATVTTGELFVDLNGGNPTIGAQHRFQIEDAQSVELLDGGLVDGAFPIVGNTFTIGSVTVGQLSTANDGPVASAYSLCAASVTLLDFSHQASIDDVDIMREQFVLESTDGGMVIGSNGTPYFTSIKMKAKSNGVTVMGPTELAMSPGATQATIDLADSFLVLNGSTKHLQMVATLSCDEDAPGEFLGHHYRLVKKPFMVGDVVDKVYNEPLPTSHMPPQGDIVGNEFQVVAQPSATYCDPWSNPEFGFLGCCGTFAQIAAGQVQPGMLIKGSSHTVYYFGSNLKRYVFPSTVILDSWYGPYDANGIPTADGSACNQVRETTDTVIASIPIGANMTFKPGVYMTGLMTDPARYVVSRWGVLRRLMPTSLQSQIYPVATAARLKLNKDAFFVNYTIGSDITDPSQYDLAYELSTTIEQNLGLAP